MNKVLYIAGYGRSGSTVLDVMLGNHPEIVSVGELAYLVEDWNDPERPCACGRSYRHCDFWQHLADDVSLSEDMQDVIRRIEKRSRTLPVLWGGVTPEEREKYRAFQQQLFSYIRERSEKSIVLDSSKSARNTALRFYALSELADLEVYVIHLIRDGRATMESHVRKGSNWALEGYRRPKRLPGLRAALGWTLANAWSVGLAKRYLSPDRHIRVHFEELTSRPASVLRRIGRFLEVDVDMLVEKIKRQEGFRVGHNVGGNRVRLKKQIRLQVSEASARDKQLEWYHKLCFEAVGGWMQRFLLRAGQPAES